MDKWSYSSFSLFMQCPRKYYRLKVKKDIKEKLSTALIYGKSAHSAAEYYVRDNKPLPSKFSYLAQYLNILKDIKGTQLCEFSMGLTKDLEPCEFNAKEAWWRGIADLIILCDNGLAYVVDYKTGKSAKFADTKQLDLLAIATFKHFKVDYIKAALVFVVSQDLVKSKYARNELDSLWAKFQPDIERMEMCYETDVWNPKENFTCKKYCPVKDCEHNGAYRG